MKWWRRREKKKIKENLRNRIKVANKTFESSKKPKETKKQMNNKQIQNA